MKFQASRLILNSLIQNLAQFYWIFQCKSINNDKSDRKYWNDLRADRNSSHVYILSLIQEIIPKEQKGEKEVYKHKLSRKMLEEKG
jgi:hypothetical protein